MLSVSKFIFPGRVLRVLTRKTVYLTSLLGCLLFISNLTSPGQNSWFLQFLTPVLSHLRQWHPVHPIAQATHTPYLIHQQVSSTLKIYSEPIPVALSPWTLLPSPYLYFIFPHSSYYSAFIYCLTTLTPIPSDSHAERKVYKSRNIVLFCSLLEWSTGAVYPHVFLPGNTILNAHTPYVDISFSLT